jgi:Flp pilus assembly protein TadD
MRLMVAELPREVREAHLLLSLAQLEKALARGARSPAVHDELGAVLELLGRADGAVRAYTEAVRLAPKEARLRVKRGWAHERLGQYDEAAADFAAALALDPAHAEAHAGLGYVHACRGQRTAGASRHASAAALHGGGDYLILHNIACVYGKLSQTDPPRAREFQDLALVFLAREVELWRRDRSGPDPVGLIRSESAFPPALRERPEFQRLLKGDP